MRIAARVRDSMVFTYAVLNAGASQSIRLQSEMMICSDVCAGAWGNIIDNNHVRTGPDMVGHIDCTKSCDILRIYNRLRGCRNRSTICFYAFPLIVFPESQLVVSLWVDQVESLMWR